MPAQRWLRSQMTSADTNQPLAQVTPPNVERCMGSMQSLSDATLRRALNALSSMFRWAVSLRVPPLRLRRSDQPATPQAPHTLLPDTPAGQGHA